MIARQREISGQTGFLTGSSVFGSSEPFPTKPGFFPGPARFQALDKSALGGLNSRQVTAFEVSGPWGGGSVEKEDEG